MVVSIRLTRLGCRNHPFYRVIVTDSKAGRDGKHIEVLGFYNPKIAKDDEKRMSIKLERVKYWLSVGAQPSDTVQSLLYRAGLETSDDGLTPNQEPPTNGTQNEVDGISPEAVFSIGLPVN